MGRKKKNGGEIENNAGCPHLDRVEKLFDGIGENLKKLPAGDVKDSLARQIWEGFGEVKTILSFHAIAMDAAT
jgi:hypothetical protein